MTHELINTERKTGGNFTFLRSTILVGDNREYQVIEDVTYEGNKEFFVSYTVCCYSHGNMTPNEFEKFLKDQQKGLEVASFLTRAFCSNKGA